MSDSDDDLLPESVMYQHDRPVNNTNVTSYSFRSNLMPPNVNMANLERQRYGIDISDQRNLYNRRETSPMSQRSLPNFGIRNFQNSFYSRGMGSQRSVYNGRSGSPMSMRSIDSNASISAADIALIFKTNKFNKYEFNIIKEAYNKHLKNRVRKRIEKRRNLKLSRRRNRHRRSDSSGELGIDSDLSDDDCRSKRSSQTIIEKENLSKLLPRPNNADLMNIRNTIIKNDMYKDCTKNIKQNSFNNMFTVKNTSLSNTSHEKSENSCGPTLKDRFKKGGSFLLPSQRFNKSIANVTNNQNVNTDTITDSLNVNTQCLLSVNRAQDFNSETEDIFPIKSRENYSSQQNSTIHQKRILETNETNSSERKRNKVTISPIKPNECNSAAQNNDFDFKKPQMPVRKSNTIKKDVAERLIAKSGQPLTESLGPNFLIGNKLLNQKDNYYNGQQISERNKELLQNSIEIETDCTNQKETTQTSIDVSMRPSFIKRKLFTQNLDVAEKKNISNDNINVNSPQNKLYSECREKNKVRKLVTSQSCLSRDVLGDNNVLNLIHKIVPPDQMNITSATNKKDTSKNNLESNDKWDVASVISMCNSDEHSDTYTDEEIFKAPHNTSKKKTKEISKEADKQVNVKNMSNEDKKSVTGADTRMVTTNCKIVIKKLKPDAIGHNNIKLNEAKSPDKKTVSKCVRTFWDTDFESDMDEISEIPLRSGCQAEPGNGLLKDTTNILSNVNNISKRNTVKGTILTVRSFQSNNKGIYSSTRSDISRSSIRKQPALIINEERSEENNNEVLNKSIQTKRKVVKEDKNKNAPNSKKHSKKSEINKQVYEKSKIKPVQSKESRNNKTQSDIDDCNTTRESVRLKQKREKAKLNLSTLNIVNAVNDKGNSERQSRRSQNNIKHSVKSNNKTNKSKETSKNKCASNPTVKNKTINKNRQTPTKGKERKQLSMSINDQSSLNISNILTRSLRLRQKKID